MSADNDDSHEFTTAKLRDGETRDDSMGHALNNLEMFYSARRDGNTTPKIEQRIKELEAKHDVDEDDVMDDAQNGVGVIITGPDAEDRHIIGGGDGE